MSELQGPRIPGEERSGRRRRVLWIVLGLIALLLLALLIPLACQALSGGGGDPSGGGGATQEEAQQGGGDDTSGGDTSVGGGTTTAVEGGETTGDEGAGAQAGISAELERPADQRGDGSEVAIPRATISGVSGWVAIHRDAGGEPGDVIGAAPLREGENAGVRVSLDERAETGTLYAMIHAEEPADGDYTFPDGDPPVRAGGEVVVQPFGYTVVGADSEPLPSSGGISPMLLISPAVLALAALTMSIFWLARRRHA